MFKPVEQGDKKNDYLNLKRRRYGKLLGLYIDIIQLELNHPD
jgi:hypothetical protein